MLATSERHESVHQAREFAGEGDLALSENGRSKALAIADAGVTTSGQFTALMSALMGDLLNGTVDALVGNAVCNAGGKMLKVLELRLKLGKKPAPPELDLIA